MKWVQFLQHGDNLELEIEKYTVNGMSDFSPNDGTPFSLKALLFNRYCKSGYIEYGGEDFRDWYLQNYLQE